MCLGSNMVNTKGINSCLGKIGTIRRNPEQVILVLSKSGLFGFNLKGTVSLTV